MGTDQETQDESVGLRRSNFIRHLLEEQQEVQEEEEVQQQEILPPLFWVHVLEEKGLKP